MLTLFKCLNLLRKLFFTEKIQSTKRDNTLTSRLPAGSIVKMDNMNRLTLRTDPCEGHHLWICGQITMKQRFCTGCLLSAVLWQLWLFYLHLHLEQIRIKLFFLCFIHPCLWKCEKLEQWKKLEHRLLFGYFYELYKVFINAELCTSANMLIMKLNG